MKPYILLPSAVFLVPACGPSGRPSGSIHQAMNDHKRVIILCTGNSCRSQMAEAIWKDCGGDQWEVVSAGTRPSGRVSPLAIKAMAEKGIDISGCVCKSSAPFAGQRFDLVITVCDNAERECPVFSNAGAHLHWPFEDPVKAPGDDEEKMRVCRHVRDGIEARILEYLAEGKRAASR